MAWTQATINNLRPKDRSYKKSEDNLIVRVAPNGHISFFVYLRRNDVHIGNHPDLTLRNAKKKKETMFADMHMGKLVESSSTFEEFVWSEAFQDFSMGRTTHKARMDSMKATILPILGKVRLREFNKSNITRYKNRRKAQGILESTINRELNDVSGVLTVALDLYLIRAKIKVEKFSEDKGKTKRILEPHEVKALRRSASSTKGLNKRMIQQRRHIALCIDIGLWCGLRRGEILQLQWGDIVNKGHFKKMFEEQGGLNVVITDGQVEEIDMEAFKNAIYSDYAFQIRGSTTKTKQSRLVPIPQLLLSELKNYYLETVLDDEQEFNKWVEVIEERAGADRADVDKIISKDTTQEELNQMDFDTEVIYPFHPDHESQEIFPYADISNSFITTRKKAGLDKEITFHSLRHNFCTRCIEGGMDLKDVKELAGHASIVTTERYLHSNPQRKFEEYQKFEKLMMKSI